MWSQIHSQPFTYLVLLHKTGCSGPVHDIYSSYPSLCVSCVVYFCTNVTTCTRSLNWLLTLLHFWWGTGMPHFYTRNVFVLYTLHFNILRLGQQIYPDGGSEFTFDLMLNSCVFMWKWLPKVEHLHLPKCNFTCAALWYMAYHRECIEVSIVVSDCHLWNEIQVVTLQYINI